MTKNITTNKSGSTPTSRGKKSVKKGAKFENTVADLFRLLGAEVVQNIEICQKKVDIFVTFQLPGSPTGHRVIVECKDEKRAVNQNQRVMQFKGLLETSRKTGEADSAEIITRVPWSDQAKGFARQSGIALLTYTEKIAQLINFTTYLKDTIDRFENGDPSRLGDPPLGAYYVDLSAERIIKKETERIPVIDDYVHQWMRDNTLQHLAILGEYGTGKSSWCQKLAHNLASSHMQMPDSVRIPILFNLREFTKTLKIDYFISSFLDEECGVLNPRFKLFQAMNDAGIFLLIFDGFDEMAVKVDADTLEINLQEIEKLASSPKSKVIITSRLEYFISGEEEQKSFHPKGELLATRQIEYETLKIVPWENKQVKSFLKKRVPLIKEAKQPWTYYYDHIKKIDGLSDLSRRPVLLDMIVKTLPKLIASDIPINRPNLYETYLKGEIKRQKILKKRTLLLTEDSRFLLLQHLALDFYVSEISMITFTDGQKHIEKVVKPPKGEIEAYTRDFLTCSFLIRKGDEYQFSHRSIMEYLIAKGLFEEIENNAPNTFNRHRLEHVVAGFIMELNPNVDTLWNWIESTKSEVKEDSKYLGGNSATLLCMLDRNALAGQDLSRTVLTGANLKSSDLKGANLNGTVMKSIDLRKAQFLKKELERANISDTIFSVYYFGNFTNHIQMEDFIESNFLSIDNESSGVKFIRASWSSTDDEKPGIRYYGVADLQSINLESVELVKKKIETHSGIIATFIYADEYEKLTSTFYEYPELMYSDFTSFLNYI